MLISTYIGSNNILSYKAQINIKTHIEMHKITETNIAYTYNN